ncbi:WD repeat protein [Aspergillus stella-maris]|uniref:WD repeat protein n=1 Tax=Aspergillus stella-maris TaxID=1810926 RepID=UPI003CCD66F3
MADLPRLPTRGSTSPAPPPPPPPASVQQSQNKNPQRGGWQQRGANALAKLAQPLFSGSRPPSPHGPGVRTDQSAAARSTRSRSLPGASQTVTHKTGISIAALDISPQRTHAVIGGKEVLKTIRVLPDHSSEEFNLRHVLLNNQTGRPKDQLIVRDVKWSHGHYDQIIATAVANGRIILYDLHRPGLEYCRFHGHSRQVHRLAFNPHQPAWLLSGSQDANIRMWDLRDAKQDRGVPTCSSTNIYNGNSDAIRDIRWSPLDGVLVAAATDSGSIQLWDVRKQTSPVLRITAHDRPCYSVDWHPNGKHLVSAGTDKLVKVWEFTTTAERRQKPLSQFRTPQAVLNVRWRPPSWSSETEGLGDWQSSQVVTSYDKEDPRVHLWDFRRPHIPFRELNRYDSTATDLLWHSKDLLWTVGDGGLFTQTDIRYAPQVVNQRPNCSVAWGPSGEVLAFSQKRLKRNTLGLSTNDFIGHIGEWDLDGETPSQSPPDEAILDEPLFASIRHRHSKSSSIRTSKSLGSTPPTAPDLIPTLPLERMLSKNIPSTLCQRGMMVSIPGATLDQETFQYLARSYTPIFHDKLSVIQTTALPLLLDSLSHNAQCAEDVALPQLAQTWRVLEYAIIQELQARERARQELPGKGSRNVKKKASFDDTVPDKVRQLGNTKHDKMKNRFFKGVTDNEIPKHTLSEFESTSNMPTPIVQPLPDSRPGSYESSNSQFRSLEDAEDIHPLPPSVLSSNQGTMASNDWSSMSDIGSRPIHQLQHRESNDSENVPIYSDGPPPERRDSVPNGDEKVGDEQRSAPLAITGRSDWHNRARPQLTKQTSDVDEIGQKNEDRRAALRDYYVVPKKPLSLEAHAGSAKPGFFRHESTESFPMFSASTASSHPSKSPGASFTSATRLRDASAFIDDGHSSSSRNETLIRARSDSIITTSSIPEEDIEELLSEGPVGNGRIHLERPSSPTPLLKESTPLKSPDEEDDDLGVISAAVDGAPAHAVLNHAEGLPRVSIPILSEQSSTNPWSAEKLLKEAVRFYNSSTNADIQSAAHLLQKLHILYEDSENVLPSEESQAIFKAYNESLIRRSMYIEAAELRSLCFPFYPAVYEYATGDTSMNVFCFTCKKPYENPKSDNTRCHRCSTPQDPCSICMSLHPPPEWVAEQTTMPVDPFYDPVLDNSSCLTLSHSSLQTEVIPPSELQRIDGTSPDIYQRTRPKGSTLWTWCQGCGHGGHLACISTWLKDVEISEGGCATPGCMHDCAPGPRREHNRKVLLEESKRRDTASRKAGVNFVKRDTWARNESKAVEQVRGLLNGNGVPGAGPGQGPIIGAGPGPGPAVSSGSGVPKGSTSATTTANASAGPGTASSNLVSSPKKVRLVTPSEQERPLRTATGSNRTSFG